jgi:acetylornithine aminotransferase
LETVANKGHYLRTRLQEKIGSNHHVKEIRGIGLLVGIELDVAGAPLINAALNAGLLILSTGKGNVVRLAPPLTISEKELNAAVDILAQKQTAHLLTKTLNPNPNFLNPKPLQP